MYKDHEKHSLEQIKTLEQIFQSAEFEFIDLIRKSLKVAYNLTVDQLKKKMELQR